MRQCDHDHAVEQYEEGKDHPTLWVCRRCGSTFPVIGDTAEWASVEIGQQPWENVVIHESTHMFTAPTAEGPFTVQAHIRSFAETEEAAEVCSAIAFRSMLDLAGIPWRKMPGDGGHDSAGETDR